MIPDTFIIAGSAASVGFIHTILGPDHYLPLVAMAKANGWSGAKTASYTAVCGFSHILGTIIIGSWEFRRVASFIVWCILFCLGCEMGYPQKKDGTRC